ncbi:MAG: hypothetical protein A2W99_13275 [Bacteroidetes bacterium GWF2_33_16]|nr:MAG: hypothetical protein A2X00_01000 [Bacteroidetes bacterium GWE2_32_14]OFY06649.1 MAG: hypothetical protein A2W99_13275 [Bacteroidetes bacterium GWF2_33_16]
MRNVLSWNQALEKNYEPRDYSFQKEDIQLGEFEASLNFKIWAKKVNGVTCYFTNKNDYQKFQLTVYRNKNLEYKIDSCNIDFAECPTDELYKLTVTENKKGNTKLIAAELLK